MIVKRMDIAGSRSASEEEKVREGIMWQKVEEEERQGREGRES